ncbi:co-chaperone HscB [Escherichia coli]|uniref:Co-chaperone protein HscB n=1 Tax=Escherichia coli TaxID=562 RepID=A0A377AIE3_ECOLX|nr:co-chaperone HscB [Escherichia coli]
MDYFTLFGLPARYQLDTQALSLRFQDLQRQYHPDKFASGSQAEQLAAVQQSATINQAWQTLRHPLMRAEYCFLCTALISPASSILCATPRS